MARQKEDWELDSLQVTIGTDSVIFTDKQIYCSCRDASEGLFCAHIAEAITGCHDVKQFAELIKPDVDRYSAVWLPIATASKAMIYFPVILSGGRLGRLNVVTVAIKSVHADLFAPYGKHAAAGKTSYGLGIVTTVGRDALIVLLATWLGAQGQNVHRCDFCGASPQHASDVLEVLINGLCTT